MCLHWYGCYISSTAPNPPRNFVVSDTLQFSWDPPDFTYGVPKVYKLSCRSIFPPDLQRNSSKEYHLDNSNRTMSIIDTQSGFSPGVTYECSVLSSNTAGDGPPAVQIVTTYPECKLLVLMHNLQLKGREEEWANPQTLNLPPLT